jgi:hypothetical protein
MVSGRGDGRHATGSFNGGRICLDPHRSPL